MKDSLQSFKKGSWWVVKGPWKYLSNMIAEWRYRGGVNLGIIEIGDRRNTQNACFFMMGDPVSIGIVSFLDNPKGRNTVISAVKKIAELARRLIRKSVSKDKDIAISQSIMKAIQEAEERNDLKAIRILKDFSVMLVSNCLGNKIPVLNPFMSNPQEAIRFAEYVNQEGIIGLNLAKGVDRWINSKEIKEFKGRHLKRHFRKYGNKTGLALLGRVFQDPEEYLAGAIAVIYGSAAKKMMYYYRGKKPSLGYFLQRYGKLLWVAVNKGRIVAFRPLKKKELGNQKVFSGLYRVC